MRFDLLSTEYRRVFVSPILRRSYFVRFFFGLLGFFLFFFWIDPLDWHLLTPSFALNQGVSRRESWKIHVWAQAPPTRCAHWPITLEPLIPKGKWSIPWLKKRGSDLFVHGCALEQAGKGGAKLRQETRAVGHLLLAQYRQIRWTCGLWAQGFLFFRKKLNKMFQKTVIDHVDAALANRVYKIRYFLHPPPKSLYGDAAAPTACLRRAGDLSRPTQTS